MKSHQSRTLLDKIPRVAKKKDNCKASLVLLSKIQANFLKYLKLKAFFSHVYFTALGGQTVRNVILRWKSIEKFRKRNMAQILSTKLVYQKKNCVRRSNAAH